MRSSGRLGLLLDDADHSATAVHLDQLARRDPRAGTFHADDRRDVWRVTRHFLEQCGAEVVIAENGQEAIDAVEQAELQGKPFALVLMDMQMPVMNGQEAVRRLREMQFKFPIIALTADVMEGDRETCLALGCDEYFPKPINGRKLVTLIAEMLGVGTG